MRVGGAQDTVGLSAGAINVAIEGESARGKQRFFQGKRSCYLAGAAEAIRFRSGQESHPRFKDVFIPVFGVANQLRTIIGHTQDGPIGGGAQGPMPIVGIGA